ncbi:UNVERIFIED_CONTAM: hypothetical protein FKN15_041842 [Acipenser sinensis]
MLMSKMYVGNYLFRKRARIHMEIIRAHKVELIGWLRSDPVPILQHCHSKILTDREYDSIKCLQNPEQLVIKLLDIILRKSDQACQDFLNILKSVTDTYPQLEQWLRKIQEIKTDASLSYEVSQGRITNQVPDAYKMTSRPRGYCVIINNKDFERARLKFPSRPLNNRKGTDIDAVYLTKVFKWLHFEVVQYNDQTAGEIRSTMERYCQQDHSNRDCFVCCILSHGLKGAIEGTDGSSVSIREITSYFTGSRCPSLKEKPKVFFIQACQGQKTQIAVKIHADGEGPASQPETEPEPEADDNHVQQYTDTAQQITSPVQHVSEFLQQVHEVSSLVQQEQQVTNPIHQVASPVQQVTCFLHQVLELTSTEKQVTSPVQQVSSFLQQVQQVTSFSQQVANLEQQDVCPVQQVSSLLQQVQEVCHLAQQVNSPAQQIQQVTSPIEQVTVLLQQVQSAAVPVQHVGRLLQLVKQTTTPARSAVSPPQQFVSPVQQVTNPPQQFVSPVQQVANPPQQFVSPVQQVTNPPQQFVSPVQQVANPPQKFVSPVQQVANPPQQFVSPVQQVTNPPQQFVSPVQQVANPPQKFVSPVQQAVSTPQQAVSPGWEVAKRVQMDTIPNDSDFLLGMATMEDYLSYRSVSKGSFYMQALCRNLELYCPSMCKVTKVLCSCIGFLILDIKILAFKKKKKKKTLTTTPARSAVSPPQQFVSPVQQVANPPQKFVSPVQQAVSTPQQAVSPGWEVAKRVQMDTIPNDSDFLLGMATMEDYLSYRSVSKGSFYMQALCRNLELYCPRNEDILSILTTVNRELSRENFMNNKQMPEPRYTLTKKLFFPVS